MRGRTLGNGTLEKLLSGFDTMCYTNSPAAIGLELCTTIAEGLPGAARQPLGSLAAEPEAELQRRGAP